MRGIGISLVAALAAASLLASPVAAKVRHRTSVVPCSKVKEAMTAGKTEDDVAKELKTTTKHVKACMNPAPKRKRAAKKA